MSDALQPRAASNSASRPTPGYSGLSAWISPAAGAAEGGDWADAILRSDGTIALTIGDVSGHGAAVAEIMQSVRTSVLHALRFVRDPSDVLTIANNFVLDRLDGRIVTAVVALVDKQRRTLTYANAGHPPPLLVTKERTSYLTQSPADIPLGIFPQYLSRTHTIGLPPKSLLVLYTDGITEHGRDVVLGELDLAEAATSVYEEWDADYARAIAQEVLKGERGLDDAATMVLRLRHREPYVSVR
jgi:serine phosphatase RsbU (regulator of sigma subunit)